MGIYADKKQKNKSQSVANSLTTEKSSNKSTFQFVDNRSETVQMRKLQEAISNSPRVLQLKALQEKAMLDSDSSQQEQLTQEKKNSTGLPDNLKAGIENLSGYSMDDVKVHYNSDKPAQLLAHAYAQGTDIHIASGQEKHLPHEAWHVVQQKQGRVKPTIQMKDRVNINDDAGLEKEADLMGGKAFQFVDNRPEAIAQRKLQETINNSAQAKPIAKVAIQKPNAFQPIQRVNLLAVLSGVSMSALMGMMAYDSYIRQINYTDKVKNIPVVANEIFEQAETAKQGGQEVDPNLKKIVAEGAIEARNRQMEDTREKITPLGKLLSVYMKKEGLTMQQLMAKYKEEHSDKSEEEIFKLIIDSAGRSNPSLAKKFLKTLPFSKL